MLVLLTLKVYIVMDQVVPEFHGWGKKALRNLKKVMKIWQKNEEIVIFYTEILTRKVLLWSFFTSEMSEKIHNSTLQVKILV